MTEQDLCEDAGTFLNKVYYYLEKKEGAGGMRKGELTAYIAFKGMQGETLFVNITRTGPEEYERPCLNS